MLKMIKNNLMPFLAGIFFTFFILMILFVIYLYNENSNLRRDVNNFQKQLSELEIKISTSNDSENITEPKISGSTETRTYLIPKNVETVPSSSTPGNNPNPDFNDGSSTEYSTGNDRTTKKETYYVPNKVKSIYGGTSGPETADVNTEIESRYEGPTETKTYLVPNQVETQLSQKASSNTKYIAKPSDNSTKVIDEYKDYDQVLNPEKWGKLKVNMTKNQVKALLGDPSRIISKIDSAAYIYKSTKGEGIIYFNRLMKVVNWTTP